MAEDFVVETTNERGIVEQTRISVNETVLDLGWRSLVRIVGLERATRLQRLLLCSNCFVDVPACVLALTQLSTLELHWNSLSSLPAAIGLMSALTELYLSGNRLRGLPREIGLLRSLRYLWVASNALECVPSELADLQALERLYLLSNQLRWLPIELDRLPATTFVSLDDNRLPLGFERTENARPRLLELFSATTHIGMIRERAATICFAMQDLELPAPLTLEILDALFPPNSIRMWAKWELVTTIKHFHQRQH